VNQWRRDSFGGCIGGGVGGGVERGGGAAKIIGGESDVELFEL
jgi:hypothetical protein